MLPFVLLFFHSLYIESSIASISFSLLAASSVILRPARSRFGHTFRLLPILLKSLCSVSVPMNRGCRNPTSRSFPRFYESFCRHRRPSQTCPLMGTVDLIWILERVVREGWRLNGLWRASGYYINNVKGRVKDILLSTQILVYVYHVFVLILCHKSKRKSIHR